MSTPGNYAVDSFNGTSAAAPHVSGVAALMMSAYKMGIANTNNPNDRLRPEDVEHILEARARDIDSPGRDDKTGAGLIQASQAVNGVFYEPVSQGGHRVIHYSAPAEPGDVTTTPFGVPDFYYIEGGKQYPATGAPAPTGNTSVPEGLYYAQAYKVTRTVAVAGAPTVNQRALGAWGLNGSINSASNVPFTFYGPPVTGFTDFPGRTTKLVTAEPGIEVVPGSYRAKQGRLELVGYAYQLMDYYRLSAQTNPPTPYTLSNARENPAHGWIPFDPTTSNTPGVARRMNCAVWLYYTPRIVGRGSAGSAELNDPSVSTTGAYPNPARTQVMLLFAAAEGEEVTAELLTAEGKVVRSERQVSKSFGTLKGVELSLAELPTGLYFYRVITQQEVQQGRFIKAD